MSTVINEKPGTAKKEDKKNREISREQIAEKAYQLWLNRGCEHGRDLEDWQQAEAELKHSS